VQYIDVAFATTGDIISGFNVEDIPSQAGRIADLAVKPLVFWRKKPFSAVNGGENAYL
jgi:hypothetical protein